MKRALSLLRAVLCVTLLVSWASVARAEVRMTVSPLFGVEAPPADAWNAFTVRLDSTEPAVVRGTVEISTEEPKGQTPGSSAPFSLSPGGSALVRLPTHAMTGWTAKITARTDAGKVLAEAEIRSGSRQDPVLVDVASPSKLTPLRGAKMSLRHDPFGRSAGAQLVTGSIWADPTTGDPILPEHAAEWGAATVVVIPSDTLARVTGPELEALVGYVLAGGTLAVHIRRPEDLRAPALVAMVGAELRDAGAAKHLASLRSATILRDATSGSAYTPPMPPPAYDPDDDESAPVVPPPVPTSPGKKPVVPTFVTPGTTIRDALVTYGGGNLVPSDFGATTAYGLGEVHILPFDPGAPGTLDDAWVQSRLVELTRHAWDRRAAVIFPQGSSGNDRSSASNDVRRQLDPNESSRWAIVVAALLLLAYSVVAGPLNFGMASRAGKPLRALLALPALSFGLFLIIVALGALAKGVRGEARRLSLTEASGGMTKGTIRRYRGLFTPQARAMTVRASDTGAVIDVAGESSSRPRLVVERGGLRLEKLATLPWQTVVVREDALQPLGGGVALVREAGDDVRVVNRTARALRSVLVAVPGRGIFHHARLADGGSIRGTDGNKVVGYYPGSRTLSGGMVIHDLSAYTFQTQWDGDAPGLHGAWSALAEAARSSASRDWWPTDQPVVLAQIEGGEGVMVDGGLRVERDRALLRVVGWGGNP